MTNINMEVIVLSSPSGLEVESRCATEFIAERNNPSTSKCNSHDISIVSLAKQFCPIKGSDLSKCVIFFDRGTMLGLVECWAWYLNPS
uniref:Uncharacterized protein n=1 Tax=Timema poppense TaxID=170557 RepID=A0A7R9DCS0_TIMPO|nr:unnamed protein product [Timema poppensis]